MEEELRRPRNVRDLTTLRQCKQEVHPNIPLSSPSQHVKSQTHTRPTDTDLETPVTRERNVRAFDSFRNLYGTTNETIGGEVT